MFDTAAAQLLPGPGEIPLEELRFWPENPRKIDRDRLEQLKRSMASDRDLLLARPLIALPDGTVFCGNQRLTAAQELGWETIPVSVVDIDPHRAREWALKDNNQYGAWVPDELAALLEDLQQAGADLDLLGFEEDELQQLLDRLGSDSAVLSDPDDVPEAPDEPITRPGDLWLLEDHRLLCGDSTNRADVAFVMNGEKARLMATDPPYFVDYTADSNAPDGSATANWDEYRDEDTAVAFFRAFLERALPHLLERAAIYQWHAHRRQALVEAAWRAAGLLVHQQIIWVKPNGVLGRSHYMWRHEPCFYGWREGKMPALKPPPDATTVWQFDQKGEQEGIHPTQKPVELFKRPLLYHTKKGEICFEPFSGSGTCIIAAEITGRRCHAIEREPAYVDVAVRRWEQFTGKSAERVERAGGES